MPVSSHTPLPQATAADSLRVALSVLAPNVARGVILRRRPMVALAAKVDADRHASRLLRRLRTRYGTGPLWIDVLGRRMLLLLDAEHVGRLLAETPQPFTPANREKRAALAHFQPHGVLISRDTERDERRRFNETVLEADRPAHHEAAAFLAKTREEAAALLEEVDATGRLTWQRFHPAFWRVVRRVVLGDAARDDHQVTDLLDKLRSDANWAYFHPGRGRLRERFARRLSAHLERAEEGSLAARLAATPSTDGTRPQGQVPHWLFAFDAAAIAAFRALALLATHPRQRGLVRAELDGRDPASVPDLVSAVYLRACVLESVRLWPTTLALLRDSTAPTEWGGSHVPQGTPFLILTSFFQRDPALPYADAFTPEVWLDGRADANWALAPFSRGPGHCPGQNLVLLVTTALLAELVRQRDYQLAEPSDLDPGRPLPHTLDHFALDFRVTPAR
ncbi:cytochrome P450 [Marinactinospora endophytica]